MRHFELDVRDAQRFVEVLCAARVFHGDAVSAETIKHFFKLAEDVQREAHARIQAEVPR